MFETRDARRLAGRVKGTWDGSEKARIVREVERDFVIPPSLFNKLSTEDIDMLTMKIEHCICRAINMAADYVIQNSDPTPGLLGACETCNNAKVDVYGRRWERGYESPCVSCNRPQMSNWEAIIEEKDSASDLSHSVCTSDQSLVVSTDNGGSDPIGCKKNLIEQ